MSWANWICKKKENVKNNQKEKVKFKEGKTRSKFCIANDFFLFYLFFFLTIIFIGNNILECYWILLYYLQKISYFYRHNTFNPMLIKGETDWVTSNTRLSVWVFFSLSSTTFDEGSIHLLYMFLKSFFALFFPRSQRIKLYWLMELFFEAIFRVFLYSHKNQCVHLYTEYCDCSVNQIIMFERTWKLRFCKLDERQRH